MKPSTKILQVRGKIVRSTFAFAALAALLAGQIGPVAASSATATAPEPITIQTLGTGMPSTAPGQAILLLRVTLQPGAAFPPHTHPGALVISVESGDFAFTVMQGEADATHGVASGTPEATETLKDGQEAIFHVGDEIFEQAGVIHTARNAGDSPAVVLVAALVDPTKPFMQMLTPSEIAGIATPAP